MILCFTGSGKGKTTAALGIALRASGHGMKTCIVQFMKGTWNTGELEALKKIQEIEIHQMGKGFYKILDDHFSTEEHQAAAEEALHFIEEKIQSGIYTLIILDEINMAADLKLISIKKVVEVLRHTPKRLHILLTGRNAPTEFLEMADLVTEMKEIKHPFQKGIQAQKGLDF